MKGERLSHCAAPLAWLGKQTVDWCRGTVDRFVDCFHRAAPEFAGVWRHLAIAAFPLILREKPRFECLLRPSGQLRLALVGVLKIRYAVAVAVYETLAGGWIPGCVLFPEVLQIHETPQCELVCNSKRFKIFFSAWRLGEGSA